MGLDNLGDTTSQVHRMAQLSLGDEDQTGHIDFEEFLTVSL